LLLQDCPQSIEQLLIAEMAAARIHDLSRTQKQGPIDDGRVCRFSE
jgi:hypothetical protein